MTDTTVEAHIAASKAIITQLQTADALVVKLRDQLAEAREAINVLGEGAHPKLRLDIPYTMRPDRERTEATGRVLADMAIKRINAVLGDRATPA
jgi:hypothetical protein